jgi:TPR repeat protein
MNAQKKTISKKQRTKVIKRRVDSLPSICYTSEKDLIEKCMKDADGGDAEAQFIIGCGYFSGGWMYKNVREAFHYWRLAADQGHLDAQLALATSYRIGDGVVQNYKEAARYYGMAVDQGYRRGQKYFEECNEKVQEAIKMKRKQKKNKRKNKNKSKSEEEQKHL